MIEKLTNEFRVFRSQPHNMQVLLGVNMLYALVLPVVEVFVGAYIMRNTNDPAMVALYQLAMYVGIILTSVCNGVLLKFVKVNILYTIGILLSAVSMVGVAMPKKYLAEMFCDRLAASRVYRGKDFRLSDPYQFFQRSMQKRILISPETAAELEVMLVKLRDEGEDAAFDYIRKEVLGKG